MEQDTRSSYIIANDISETERLKRQGRLLTKPSVMPLLPEGFDPNGKRILDLACGAGEWAALVASKYPRSEVVGGDINSYSIEYANATAALQGLENLEYRDMDILQSLEVPNHTFDLVNARLIFGVVPANYWPMLLSEIYRILKPGGMVRLVEHAASLIENAPCYHEFNNACYQVIHRMGKTFSAYEIAVVPALNRLVPAAGFIDVNTHIANLDYSAGAPLHDVIADDFIELLDRFGPLTVKYGALSPERCRELDALVRQEMSADDFSASWLICRWEAMTQA